MSLLTPKLSTLPTSMEIISCINGNICSITPVQTHNRTHTHSRSYSPYHRRGRHDRSRRDHRDRSRSPLSNRRRHDGNRVSIREGYEPTRTNMGTYKHLLCTHTHIQFNPEPSKVLGVFGLSLYTGERELRDIFSKYGPIKDISVVFDHQTGRSRGFAFVYFEDVEDTMDVRDLFSQTPFPPPSPSLSIPPPSSPSISPSLPPSLPYIL